MSIDLTKGKLFDRVSMTWLDPKEYAERRAAWDEMVFQSKANQGQLALPAVIGDGHKPVMSMTNGQIYDSKAALRAEYKRAGVEEVGNDVPMRKPKPTRHEIIAAKQSRKKSLAKALSRVGL